MSRRQKPAIDSSIPPADLPLRPSVRFRLAKNDTFFGPGVAEFLILVDQSNSMQTACKEMEMSYSNLPLLQAPHWRQTDHFPKAPQYALRRAPKK